MIDALPLKIKSYISDKISRDYTDASTLDYGKLILLGVKSCGPYEMELAYSNIRKTASQVVEPDDPIKTNSSISNIKYGLPAECLKLIRARDVRKSDTHCKDIM